MTSDQPAVFASDGAASKRFVVKLLSLDRESWMDGQFPPVTIAVGGNLLMSLSLAFRPIIFPLFVVGVVAIFTGIALAFARFDLVVHRARPFSTTKAS
jgi:hypothetical protein